MFLKRLLSTIVVSLMSSLSFAADSSPVGYWKTIDSVTGQPKSIVHIWKNEHQVLMGKVIKVFAEKNPHPVCHACRGNQHNQPILGMVIMTGLKAHHNQWQSGQLLDPENGKIYDCMAHLTENGKKLNVHGYKGLPLFGRSQMWERVDLM